MSRLLDLCVEDGGIFPLQDAGHGYVEMLQEGVVAVHEDVGPLWWFKMSAVQPGRQRCSSHL